MLLLGIMQHQAQLHTLAGQLAIGQAADSRQHGRDGAVWTILFEFRARLTFGNPLPAHPTQIVDQELRGRHQILTTAVAIGVGTLASLGIVGPRAVARARAGAVQILPPQQELDSVITGRDVGFDAANLMQLAQKPPVDHRCIDDLAAIAQLLVRDHVRGMQGIVVRGRTVFAGIDIVDQPFVQRPSVHPAFPIVDSRVTEAVGLGLLIGNAGGDPGRTGGLHRLFARLGDQFADRRLQLARFGQ